jgi:import inner membrane translocase subunit TIM44
MAKKVGETVRETASAVAETPVGRAASATIDVVGKAAEAAVKPITNSEEYKRITDALAQAIQDSSSSYGGITPKRYRQLVIEKRLLEYKMKNAGELSANADATGVVLHSSSKYNSAVSWEVFMANNPMLRGIVAVKENLAKSDNLMVSWGRWLVENVQGRMGTQSNI